MLLVRVNNPCACTAEQPYTMLLVRVLLDNLTPCCLCVYCMLFVRVLHVAVCVNNPCA